MHRISTVTTLWTSARATTGRPGSVQLAAVGEQGKPGIGSPWRTPGEKRSAPMLGSSCPPLLGSPCPPIRRLAPLWRPALLLLCCGLLLPLLIVGVSPLIAVALMSLCALALCALCCPAFALLLLFFGAGLPSLLIPLPGHTVRLVEPALLLALLVILLKRPGLRLRLPHLLMVAFVAIAWISFFHVPQISTDLNAYAADKRLYELILVAIAFFCGSALISVIKNVSSFLVAILLCHLPLYFIALAQALKIVLPSFLESSTAHNSTLADGRLWGPTSGAATFGLYLLNLFIVSLICWTHGTRRRHRAIGAIMTIASTLAIVGSGTRSAAIAAVLCVLATLIFTRRFILLITM